jgi:hypothetical protein|tara:strand:+ start:1136 stop:1381 length:246 start_codon:yes stop_codon:yes gene_type:complete
MFEVFKAELPTKRNTIKSKYPFPQMKPGTAFTVPGGHYSAQRNLWGGCAIVSAMSGWQTRHGGKWQSRRNTDDSITIYRVT